MLSFRFFSTFFITAGLSATLLPLAQAQTIITTEDAINRAFFIDTVNPNATVPAQDDRWSCGVNSSTRLVNAYNRTIDYHQAKNTVGGFEYDMLWSGVCEVSVLIERTVDTLCPKTIEDCTKNLLGAITCVNPQTVLVACTVKETVPEIRDSACQLRVGIPIGNLGMGKPPYQLYDRLHALYGSKMRIESDHTSIDDIKKLLNTGRPVMALINNGKVSEIPLSDLQTTLISTALTGTLLPLKKTMIEVPNFHYVLVVGYGDDGLTILDTDGTLMNYSDAEFDKQFSFARVKENLVYQTLNAAYNLAPRSIIWMDETVPQERTVYNRGVANNAQRTGSATIDLSKPDMSYLIPILHQILN